MRLGYSSHRVLPQITVGGWCSLRQHHLPAGDHLPHSSAEGFAENTGLLYLTSYNVRHIAMRTLTLKGN